jgi:hypothetical protein
VTKIDYGFRVLAIIALVGTGAAAFVTDMPSIPYWVAAKLIIFGGLITCGLIVRIKIKDFGPAFANLAKGHPSERDNAAIVRSLGGTRPFVVTIWIGLLASAALGLHLI